MTGLLQIALGSLKIGRLMKFIPKPVMTGFVNSLVLLLFTAQVIHFAGES
ncbi:SulP family inorganic anion transporter [Peribacillus muralis]